MMLLCKTDFNMISMYLVGSSKLHIYVNMYQNRMPLIFNRLCSAVVVMLDYQLVHRRIESRLEQFFRSSL